MYVCILSELLPHLLIMFVCTVGVFVYFHLNGCVCIVLFYRFPFRNVRSYTSAESTDESFLRALALNADSLFVSYSFTSLVCGSVCRHNRAQ